MPLPTDPIKRQKTIERMKQASNRRWSNPEYREKISKVHSHKLPEEWRQNISKGHKGIETWNKGKKGIKTYFPHYESEDHPRWKGGRNSYLRKKAKMIMEDYIGRKLRPEEVIHHLDHQIENYQIDNLHLFPSESEHQSYHELKKSFIRDKVTS